MMHRSFALTATAAVFALALSGCSADPADDATPAASEVASESDGAGDGSTDGAQAGGEEAFLNDFAAAWGALDEDALAATASDEAIATVTEAGSGVVSIVWDDDFCPVPDGETEGQCSALFMPEGQTECCSQIWNFTYVREDDGSMMVTALTFAGDAG